MNSQTMYNGHLLLVLVTLGIITTKTIRTLKIVLSLFTVLLGTIILQAR